MSGLFSIYHLDAAPLAVEELQAMVELLRPCGPDGVGLWRSGPVGLGLTLLATTPELQAEPQPVVHRATGCAIAADVRLDNREDLLAALGSTAVGDAGLILAAYLAWGEQCVARLRGDFTFALWDPQRQALLVARDPFGLRPLYYHWSAGRLFACASTARSLLALPDVPRQVNEARIADFLVQQLEGVDHTSTFFSAIYRLPPAHAALITPDGMRLWRYWTPEPRAELRLSSEDAYAEALRDVFTAAVRSRLRTAGPVGATLSGGLDSSSVVAVARELLAETGQGPLHTFSGVDPDPTNCPETKAIHAALTMPALQPHLVSYAELDRLMPELAELSWSLDEPFDDSMTLLRAVYLAAHHRDIKVMLDGGAGDIVLSEGDALARLLRRGRWLAAYRHAAGLHRFFGDRYSVGRELWRSARLAFTPSSVRRLYRRLRSPNLEQRVAANLRISLISPEFARRVHLAQRLSLLDSYSNANRLLSGGEQLARALNHPYVAAARERFWRTAAPLGIEPRDPFLDYRVVDFCLALPDDQRASTGWPKAILRRATGDRLPEAVRWRIGKEHLGWAFTLALMQIEPILEWMTFVLCSELHIIASYTAHEKIDLAVHGYFRDNDRLQAEAVYDVVHLANWFERHDVLP